MATISLGSTAILGARKEGTYGTAIKVIDKIPFTSCTVTHDPEYTEYGGLLGTAGYNDTRIVSKPVTVSLECPIVDTSIDTDATPDEHISSDLLMFMGMSSNSGFASATLSCDDAVSTFDSFTLAISHGTGDSGEVWDVAGCKVNSMTISCEAGGTLMGSFEILGQSVDLTSAVNTTAVMEEVARGCSTPKEYNFSDLDFWFGDRADALTSSDRHAISSFSLSVNNNLAQFYEVAGSAAANMKPTEPILNGFREVTLDFSFPRIDSTRTILGNAGTFAGIASMLKSGTGGDLPATQGQCEILLVQGSNNIWIGMPNLNVIKAGVMVGGGDILTEDINCTASYPAADSNMAFNTTSANVHSAIGLETKNARVALLQ